MFCLRLHLNCEHPVDCDQVDLRTFEDEYRPGQSSSSCLAISSEDVRALQRVAFDAMKKEMDAIIHDEDVSDETIVRCVDALIAEPFSMREDRAVEVARAVLKAALDR